jgi:hypothetical protein
MRAAENLGRFSVVVGLAWPSRLATVFGSTPFEISLVAT